MLLSGLATICEDVVESIQVRTEKDPLAVVLHYLMRGLVRSANSALTRYLPLALGAECLQNSSHGTPYQKWALITNGDFAAVDRALRILLQASCTWRLSASWEAEPRDGGLLQRTSLCFNHIMERHVTCAIDLHQPVLTLSGIQHLNWPEVLGWDAATGLIHGVLPPVLETWTVDISDRSRIHDLQREGFAELTRMERYATGLTEWLKEHYRLEDILAPRAQLLDLEANGFPRARYS